ncbi:MAG: hypothetical protein WKF93_07720 [Acidimicrobiales bacterium]
MLVVVMVVLALALVVGIGLVAVGREAFTLGSQPRQALFDVDEAVDFVADEVPDEVAARISYDDVRALIRFHLEHLASAGAPTERWRAGTSGLVIVGDEDGAEFLMGRAMEAGLDCTPDDIAAVLAAELAYFEAIGAIGPTVPEPLELLAAEHAAGVLGAGPTVADGDSEETDDKRPTRGPSVGDTEERRWSS